MTTTRTTGTFTFADWKESAVAGDDGGPKIAHAVVTNAFTGAIEAKDTRCVYAICYAPDGSGTGSFSGYQRCEGTVGGRAGAFVLHEWGTFDEKSTVHCSFEVLPGSATGELAGLAGTGGYTAVPGEAAVAYTFDHTLG
ncbi:DUF3224 domain-containing protein [Streptomyces sp. SBT349]|uniref:DUF3224 domain-containing protein n=1 Tax=Streptomyces sp. SBT349 TaxID=1580539 RepID=UPI00066A7DAB|nr:DUF3224 domain-containing protein [Streptomyces sp. SBT349]